jgi:hypothetical protein
MECEASGSQSVVTPHDYRNKDATNYGCTIKPVLTFFSTIRWSYKNAHSLWKRSHTASLRLLSALLVVEPGDTRRSFSLRVVTRGLGFIGSVLSKPRHMALAPVSRRSKQRSLWARTRAPLRRRWGDVMTGGGDAGRGGGSGLDTKLELLLLLLLLPPPLFFFSTWATNSVQHIPRYRDNCSSSKSMRCMQLRTSSKPQRLPDFPRLDLSN